MMRRKMRELSDLPGLVDHPLRHFTHYYLHHCQMFEIVVGLEKSIASKEFNQDTPNGKHVAWVGPW